jgi:hypothetical protein
VRPAPATADTLAKYLKKVGFEPRPVTPETGFPYCVVAVKENDGWSYAVEVTAKKDGGMWLTVPLDAVPRIDQVPAPRLLALLQASQAAAPCFFTYRAGDNRLCLRLEVLGRPGDQEFRDYLRTLLNVVRRTHPLWDTAAWQAGGAGGRTSPAGAVRARAPGRARP